MTTTTANPNTSEATCSDLLCPQCGKSDMIFATVQASTGGDRIVYDCERCEREVASEPWERPNAELSGQASREREVTNV